MLPKESIPRPGHVRGGEYQDAGETMPWGILGPFLRIWQGARHAGGKNKNPRQGEPCRGCTLTLAFAFALTFALTFTCTLIDEQEPGVIWLLRGCPRRWFTAGQSIVVEDAPTLHGTMGLCVQAEAARVIIDIDAPNGVPPSELRLAVRRPGQAQPARVTVNGTESAIENETIVLRQPTGHLQVICAY